MSCKFFENTVFYRGGSLFIYKSARLLTIQSNVFYYNQANEGGAIYHMSDGIKFKFLNLCLALQIR